MLFMTNTPYKIIIPLIKTDFWVKILGAFKAQGEMTCHFCIIMLKFLIFLFSFPLVCSTSSTQIYNKTEKTYGEFFVLHGDRALSLFLNSINSISFVLVLIHDLVSGVFSFSLSLSLFLPLSLHAFIRPSASSHLLCLWKSLSWLRFVGIKSKSEKEKEENMYIMEMDIYIHDSCVGTCTYINMDGLSFSFSLILSLPLSYPLVLLIIM
jgi:hypothetical protein